MDGVASILTVVQAGIAVTKSFKKLKQWKGAPGSLSRLKDELSEFEVVLSEIEALLQAQEKLDVMNHTSPQSLMLASEKLKRSVTELDTFIRDTLTSVSDGTLKTNRMAWTWNESQIEELRKRLCCSGNYLALCLSTNMAASQIRIEQAHQQRAGRYLEKFDLVGRQIQLLNKNLSLSTSPGMSKRDSQKHIESYDVQERTLRETGQSSNHQRDQPLSSRTVDWAMLGPERSLRFPTVRPTNSSVFFFARMGFIEEMKKLFVTGQASPLDLEYPFNKTALYVSKSTATVMSSR